MHQPSPQDIVHTVVDQAGAWAFFPDAPVALEYAVSVRGTMGGPMTREAALKMVQANYEARFGSLSHRDGS